MYGLGYAWRFIIHCFETVKTQKSYFESLIEKGQYIETMTICKKSDKWLIMRLNVLWITVCIMYIVTFASFNKNRRVSLEYRYEPTNIWIIKLVILFVYAATFKEFIYLYGPQSSILITYVLQNESISKEKRMLKVNPEKVWNCEIFNIFEQSEKWHFLFISTQGFYALSEAISFPYDELFAVRYTGEKDTKIET